MNPYNFETSNQTGIVEDCSLLIYRTNIKTKKNLKMVSSFLNTHPFIHNWSIDQDDCDKVLRIEARLGATEPEILQGVRSCGFVCEDLAD